MCTGKQVFPGKGASIPKISFRSSWLMLLFSFEVLTDFFVVLVLLIIRKEISSKKSFDNFCQFLLHVFPSSIIRCIKI